MKRPRVKPSERVRRLLLSWSFRLNISYGLLEEEAPFRFPFYFSRH